MPALGLFPCFASLLCQHCLVLLGEEGKGHFFYWRAVAVGFLRLGYTKVRSIKEGKIPPSYQCAFSSCWDGCAQMEEISTATQLASLVCWKDKLGMEHLKTLPLAEAQRPPLPPQADLPKSLLWEMVSHPHFSHPTLHIQQHFKGVRNCTKKLFAVDWHVPQTKKNLCENNLITNYRCSDHVLLWVWAAPVSEESWFRTPR